MTSIAEPPASSEKFNRQGFTGKRSGTFTLPSQDVGLLGKAERP